jgi:hypothetical protein
MAHKKLAEIVVRYIEFLEFADEEQIDSHTAVNALESIAADFLEATPEEQLAVKQAAKDRLAWFLQAPDEYGYSPPLSPEHRQLLEGIASGEVFGQPGNAT